VNRQVPTLDAELAMNRINQTLALHQADRTTAQFAGWRGRLRGTSGVVKADPSRYLVLPHIVAIAEEFSRRLLIRKTEVQVPKDRPVLEQLWLKAEDQAEGRWKEHLKAWKDWHQIGIASEQVYANLHPFIEARNAIMHGLGELARKQRRDNQEVALRGQLKHVGIDVIGTRLVIKDKAVSRCASACKAFVEDLDRRAQAIS
jgi:hypothetical protein